MNKNSWQPGQFAGSRQAQQNAVNYLRISVTDRCNYRCTYCMPGEGIVWSQPSDILSYEELLVFVRAAVDTGISRVRITGGEPLVRRDLPAFIGKLAAVEGITDLSLTTNGALLQKYAAQLKRSGLMRINISIDSLDPRRFARITRGADLHAVVAGLSEVLRLGFSPVKINVVMLKGIESELGSFVDLVRRLPVHVRFIELMPIGRQRFGQKDCLTRKRLMSDLKKFGDLHPVRAPEGGGPARYFKIKGARGSLGFIGSMSDNFCSSCNRLRLTAPGRLRNCLFSGREVNIRPLINGDPVQLKQAILGSMNSKGFDRRKERPAQKMMSQIGG